VGFFIRLTVVIAIAIVGLVVLWHLLQLAVVAAVIAAFIVAGLFVVGFFRRLSSRPGPLVRR
jgi:O-antigen/teichoic acid export membrane protein